MNSSAYMSYREVIPRNLNPEEWIEVEINTGTQSTLQDIKTFGKSGSYSYKASDNTGNRNRFLYWRTYQDVLELCEVSLDISLMRNHLRLRFTDSAVLNVSVYEHEGSVVLLVVTVSSLHHIAFSMQTNGGAVGPVTDIQKNSIFYDANVNLKERNIFYVLDGSVAINVPQLATSQLSVDNQKAYFAVDYQSKLMLYTMNCTTGSTTATELKESHLMPRFLTNLKGALIGRAENVEAAVSMAFSYIEGRLYLLVLYRDNELRLWSTSTLQIISSINCSDPNRAQGPQNSLMRKIDNHNYCVFLPHESFAEFMCISIICRANEAGSNTVNLAILRKLPGPEMDLIDFDATASHIWTLSSNAHGDINIAVMFLGDNGTIQWVTAGLEPPPDRYCLTVNHGQNPREAYCSYIFHPGRFDHNVIAKALYMFRRVNMQFDIKQLTVSMLKEQVCQAVEEEIQNEMKEYVVSDEEYLEIATKLWDRFYSCCEQYHIKFSEPTGLAVLHGLDVVCVVRRQSFALLRPCEMLEHMMLAGESMSEMHAFVASHCVDNDKLVQDFVLLMEIICSLEKVVTEDMKIELDKRIYQRDNDGIESFFAQITSGNPMCDLGMSLSRQFIDQIKSQSIPAICDLDAAINMLLDLLDVVDQSTCPDPSAVYTKSKRFLESTGAFFGSDHGIPILAETVSQVAKIRYAVCRNLQILQYIDLSNSYKRAAITTIRNYMYSYYTILWISEQTISLNAPANFEVSLQRLTRAQLFSGYTRPYSSQIRCNSQTTLLSLFLQSKGLFSALSMLLKDSKDKLDKQLTMRETLLLLVGYINQMLWPEAKNDIFPEWLFGTCHHIIIQDYVRLLDNWCQEKICSRRFMLGVSLLDCGEAKKAIDMFAMLPSQLLQELFLFELVFKGTPVYSTLRDNIKIDGFRATKEDEDLAWVHYCMKIIQLLEQYSASNCIIDIAKLGMAHLEKEHPQTPMFQSIIFNNHLKLGHYEEAYHDMVFNADASRRKDCLRQLVIMLFEQKQLDMLMQLPYTNMTDEFENIVESRARSQAIDQNDGYNFLYAYHIKNDNMRKAAIIMYEHAMRLKMDGDGPDVLDKLSSSLLIVINCLCLVDSRYRWIAKPRLSDDKPPMVEKQIDEPENDEPHDIEEDVVVLELEDIRRELLHTNALKELSYHCKDATRYKTVGADELLCMMATSGLYTAGLRLAEGFDISVLPIFENLAVACVNVTEERSTDGWSWLQKNDLADLPHLSNAGNMAWSLLRKLIEDHEQKGSTKIRKSVVNSILEQHAFLPQWLINSYKLDNSRELVHLLIKHSRLLEAADLACEMISGMLGAGSEYFDFQHSVNVTNPQLAFPINTIDLLLHGLRINGKEHIDYEMARVKLEEDVERYITTVKRTTEDKIKRAILTERENRQQQQIYN